MSLQTRSLKRAPRTIPAGHPAGISVLILCGVCGAQEASAQVTVEYDRYENHTVVSTEPVDLVTPIDRQFPGSGSVGVELTVAYSCPGSELCKPATVQLWFIAESTSWRYLRLHKLVMLADTVRIDLGELKHDGSVGMGYVLEFMSITIPLETFRLMTWAGRLIGKLGTTEFELTNREPFRALFEKMR